MKVRYNRGALADLTDILTYIAAHNPVAAAAQLEKFEAAARLIGRYPEIGKQTSRPHLRRIVVGNFLMVYEVSVEPVTIHYVRRGSRARPWEDQ
jgi:toxin ParE1/3/4